MLTVFNGTTVSNSSYDWGAWTELHATAASTYGGLLVTCTATTGASDNTSLVSIGFGASGSEVEVAVINSSSHGAGTGLGQNPAIYLPILVPKGTRIAGRSSYRSAVVFVSGFPETSGVPTRLESYFARTFFSGQYLTNPYSLGASSAWQQITASTTSAYRGLILSPGAGVATMDSNTDVTITLGIGASGAEVEIGTCRVNTSTAEAMVTRHGSTHEMINRHIPAGTRIAVKQSSARTYFNAMVIGVPY